MTVPQNIQDLLDVVAPYQQASVRALIKPVAGGSPVVAAVVARTGFFRSRTTPAPQPSITDSYVGGHPFLPDNMAWPVDAADEPMNFIAQVNFTDVPELPGFPSHGLLQMFVAADDTWGLTFDDTNGLVGFHCRWFTNDDLALPVSVTPMSAFPTPTDTITPIEDPTTPHMIRFELDAMLPQGGWEHGGDDVAANPHGFAALETAWDDHEIVADGTLTGWDVQVGGWPSFVQGAPATPEGRSAQLILGLNSCGLMMWGDVGTAHLFGDPAALAEGDLSGLWWEWSCS